MHTFGHLKRHCFSADHGLRALTKRGFLEHAMAVVCSDRRVSLLQARQHGGPHGVGRAAGLRRAALLGQTHSRGSPAPPARFRQVHPRLHAWRPQLTDNGQNDRRGSNTVRLIIAKRWEMLRCRVVLLSLKGCFISVSYRYEELRYWYDCLFYEEELRQYHDYIAAIEEIESRHYHEVVFFFLPFNHLIHFLTLYH